MNPKVSVIVNCLNGEKYVERALNSIFAQSCQNFEVIFFDNCSIDDSANIAKKFIPKLRYFRKDSTVPLGQARAEAIKYAEGEWVGFLDVDDVWYPHKLATQLEGLANGEYVFCYAGVREVSEKGSIIRNALPVHRSGFILDGLLRQFDVNMVTPMFNRAFAVKYGFNFEPSITASEEYNLFMRMSAKGRFLVQDEILGDYLVHSGSLTSQKIENWCKERRFTLAQLKQENPGIQSLYKASFAEAYARADYYEARFFMEKRNNSLARKVLKNTSNVSWIYSFLRLLTFSRPAWMFLHNEKLRRNISRLIYKLRG